MAYPGNAANFSSRMAWACWKEKQKPGSLASFMHVCHSIHRKDP